MSLMKDFYEVTYQVILDFGAMSLVLEIYRRLLAIVFYFLSKLQNLSSLSSYS